MKVVKNRRKTIEIVELEARFPNMGQLSRMPRYGITAVGSVLANAGNDVRVLADIFGRVSLDEVLERNPDYVLFNGMKNSMERVREMANAIKERNPEIPIIIGGEEATMNPEGVRDFADIIVLNEGEETIKKLIGRDQALSEINGIQYRNEEGEWETTPQADRIKEINYVLDPLIFRGIDSADERGLGTKLLAFPIQTSRGCKYNCSFCTQRTLFGKPGYQTRALEDILRDIESVTENTPIQNFLIVDNLFGGDKNLAIEMFRKVQENYSGEKIPHFAALMRADQFTGKRAFSPEEIQMMHAGGLESVFIGMESVNPETLKDIQKGSEVQTYVEATSTLKKEGVQVGGTFGVGGGSDTKYDVRQIVDFARSIDLDSIQLYAYTIIPGTSNYENSKHQIIEGVPDYLINGHGVSTFPKKMLPSELQVETLNAMEDFYKGRGKEGVLHRRQVRAIRDSMSEHILNLQDIEREMIQKGIYQLDSENNWTLNEELLKANPVKYAERSHSEE
jgi:anaerobic magnesium-protoporphyrin IX monomethyl ester cyclase